MNGKKKAIWKYPLLLSTIVFLLMALMACGGNIDTVVEPTQENVEAVEEEAAAEEDMEEGAAEEEMTAEEEAPEEATGSDEAETTLRLWVIGEQRVPVLNQLGQQFADEFGVGVTVEVVDLAEVRNQFLLGAGTGEGPDMAIIPHDNIGALVENGVLAEIDLGSKADNFLEPAIDAFIYDGALYGVPVAVENIGFFRNVEMVPEAPTTWEEVYTVGQELVESGEAEMAIALPDLGYNIYPLYTSYGGYIFGRDGSGSYTSEDIGLDSEGMIEGMTWIKDLVDAGLVSPNIDWEAAHVLFEEGHTPFITTGPWALTRFREAGVPYEVSAFPAATESGEPGVPFLGVQGLVVNVNSPDALLAQTFATEVLATEVAMQALFDEEPTPSAWASVFESASDPDIVGFSEAGIEAQPMPAIPAMGAVWDPWANAGTLVVQGELSPEEALTEAEEQVQAQIEENQ